MQIEQAFLRTDAPPAHRQRTDDVVAAAHRGDRAGDDLAEHLGDDGQRLVARQRHEPLVECRVRDAERSGSSIAVFFVADQRAQLLDRGAPPALRRDRPGRDRFEQAPRFEHVGERDVARLEHERGRARGHALVGLVDDDAAAHAAHDGDETFGLEDAQRFAQRRPRHAEPLDEVGLVAERVALGQLARDDQAAQLVGDLLRFLARSRRAALGVGVTFSSGTGKNDVWRCRRATPARTSSVRSSAAASPRQRSIDSTG